MIRPSTSKTIGFSGALRSAKSIAGVFMALCLLAMSPAQGQEVRYSWLDISFMGQDVGRSGTQLSPIAGQFVEGNATDGDGVRFRGSVGTWNNFYAFVHYGSTDIDFSGTVFSPLVPEGAPFSDEFDYTTIRGGLGLKWSVTYTTDLYAELTYDSLDMDFGSLVGESFDTDDQDVGGALGVRWLLHDDFLVEAYGRYSNHADVDLTTLEFDTGSLIGIGLAWQVISGFSIIGDYESGDMSSWSIGFRLDLDEAR
jgi:hypothetical protein